MRGAANAPMLHEKLRNVSNDAQRSGKVRPVKSVTADMGTPTLIPSRKKTGSRRALGLAATARQVAAIARNPIVIVLA